MFRLSDSTQHFYTNWHPLRSIKQWTSDEPNVSLHPLAVLTIQYITTAFLPTTSFGFTMLLGSGPPSAGMMSLCLATAKGPQGLQMCLLFHQATVERLVLLDFTPVLVRSLPKEKSYKLKYRNLNAHTLLSWFQASEL